MPPLSVEHRLAAFYAALFASIGASAPFVSLWLDSRALSPTTIGVIVAAPSIAMVATTVGIGALVDRLDDRRRGLLILNAAALGAYAALSLAEAVWAILVLWALGGLLKHAIAPITDAFALGLTRERGTDWARVRLAGSVGFVLALLGAGYVFETFGIASFLPVLIALTALRLLAALMLPSGNHPRRAIPSAAVSREIDSSPPLAPDTATGRIENSAVVSPVGSSTREAGNLYQPAILLTIGGAALVNASHALFYAFGLLIWTRAGISETAGSLLWVTGVIAEMAIMWRFRAIAARISARVCLLIAGGAAVLRWSLSALDPTAWLLVPVQCLHALTFGLGFLATANFIARRVSTRQAARGQALAATIATASMAVATALAGALYERIDTAAYGLMVVLALLGMGLVALSYRTALPAEAA